MNRRPAPVAALQALDGLDAASADAVACQRRLGEIKRVRGFLDAVEADVTARLDELASQGESFGSEATHVRCSGVSSKDAGKLKERAHTLGQADGFTDALATGTVTASHVDRLAAVAGHLADEVKTSLLERSDELLQHALANDPGRFGRHVRDLARHLERAAGISRDQQQRANTYLTVTVAGDGMYDLHGRLHPELGAKVKQALDRHVAAMITRGETAGVAEYLNRTVNRARLAADALGQLIGAGQGTIRPTVADITVLIDAATLVTGEFHDHSVCETGHGAPLPIGTVRRLICNAFVTGAVIGQNGVPLEIGRTTRTPNRAQRRALRALYRTCACHGCDTPFDQCELHHIVPWELGGPTDLINLVPVCARHHHLIHTLAWRLHLTADRTLTITDRNGQIMMITTPDMPHPSRHTNPPPDQTTQRRTEPTRATPNLLAS